jgi:hypothetical protein
MGRKTGRPVGRPPIVACRSPKARAGYTDTAWSQNRFWRIATPSGRFAAVCYRRGLSNSFSRWISRFRTWAAISSQRG